MAHTPLKMTIAEAHAEVKYGWAESCSPEGIGEAVDLLEHKPLGYRINIFIARICFRGIYFPQMGRLAWLNVIAQNRRTIFKLVIGALRNPSRRRSKTNESFDPVREVSQQN